MNPTVRTYVAEAIGTFYLCFIGAGAICAYSAGAPLGIIGIALAHGLALAVGISATMAASGGQLNPAVSIALFVTRRIDGKTLVNCILAQLTGALVAGVLLRWIYPQFVDKAPFLGTPGLGEGVTPFTGVVVEAILTFLLVFSVFGTAVDPRAPKIGGFGIGLTVAFDILAGGPISGAAMNPARHLGIALASGHLENSWIYWVGPVAGGCLAALIYETFIMEKKKT